MKRFAIWGLVLVLSAATFFFVNDRPNLGIGKNHYVFNQKITLTFDTPNGLVVASNVGQVEWLFQPDQLWDPKSGNRYFSHGEALVADLGDENHVFMLISEARLARRIVETNGWIASSPREWRDVARFVWSRQGEVWEFSPELLKLVSIPDLSNLESFAVLNPMDITDVLGDGYTLTTATFQIVDEPITNNQIIPLLADWLINDNYPAVIRTTDSSSGLPVQISKGNFVRGDHAQALGVRY